MMDDFAGQEVGGLGPDNDQSACIRYYEHID